MGIFDIIDRQYVAVAPIIICGTVLHTDVQQAQAFLLRLLGNTRFIGNRVDRSDDSRKVIRSSDPIAGMQIAVDNLYHLHLIRIEQKLTVVSFGDIAQPRRERRRGKRRGRKRSNSGGQKQFEQFAHGNSSFFVKINLNDSIP